MQRYSAKNSGHLSATIEEDLSIGTGWINNYPDARSAVVYDIHEDNGVTALTIFDDCYVPLKTMVYSLI